MDGLLLIDKPAGPTSHDVVARMRQALHEPRIGHTGTLDPAASGLLPLVLGRATRLARFLSASDKTYDAHLRLGIATDSGDAHGRRMGDDHAGRLPSRDVIEQALDAFRGTYLQQPPAFSAKKIGGQRSYRLARRARLESASATGPSAGPVRPPAARVTVNEIEIVKYEGADLGLIVTCSAGFYVRSLAHDLGQRLGTGAHLAALRRTRAGMFAVGEAIELATAERDPGRALTALIPLPDMLPGWSAAVLTADGVRRARDGRDLGPADFHDTFDAFRGSPPAFVRLMDSDGELVGIAEPAGTRGLLHPSVVLR
jgi:tRNA pseudouridine55 synthase